MSSDFHIKAHAKWILAGEHAVLRGYPALVFPIPSKMVELFYWHHPEPLEVDFNAPFGDTFMVLFWGVFDEALKLLDKKHHNVEGRFFFRNNIPMGAGMGFSAAFCVCLTKFFQWKNWILEKDAFEFARKLEDHFHGKSSGVDIAGCLYDGGMYFRMNGDQHPIQLNWRPHLYLSHSGHISVTSKCIHLVNELWERDKVLAEKIDEEMGKSTELCEEALKSSEMKGFSKLKEAIETANNCFKNWGLINHDLENHMKQLREAGAMACKPTGAGDGGYVISLWEKIPELPFEMIAVF
jgi:mevalonate kinase